MDKEDKMVKLVKRENVVKQGNLVQMDQLVSKV
jgi:hypothetical protein